MFDKDGIIGTTPEIQENFESGVAERGKILATTGC